MVGVYRVFASLIIPALATARLGTSRSGTLWAFGLGGVSYAGGLICSALFDLPSGPLIVGVLALFGVVLALALQRRYPPATEGVALEMDRASG